MDQKEFCMNCGTSVDANANACPNCGTPMPKKQSTGYASAPIRQFCASCGTTVEGNVSNCPNCGAAINSAPISGGATAINGGSKNLLIPLVAIGALLAVVIVVFVLIFGDSKEDPLDNFVEAVEDCDAGALMDMYPEAYLEYLIDEYDYDDEDELEEEWQDNLDDMYDELEDELGEDISVSYEVLKEKELDEDDIDDLVDNFEDYYDVDVEIDEAYELKVKFTIEGDDDDAKVKTNITVMEIDGDWVATDISLGSLF